MKQDKENIDWRKYKISTYIVALAIKDAAPVDATEQPPLLVVSEEILNSVVRIFCEKPSDYDKLSNQQLFPMIQLLLATASRFYKKSMGELTMNDVAIFQDEFLLCLSPYDN